MTQHRILIAGIGNIFMGDDAFGCEVTQKLMLRTWPHTVRIVDFGIRGLDLAYAIMEGYETTILVDATPQGSAPGTIYAMELSLDDAGDASAFVDAHSMHPLNVLKMVRTLGGVPGRILLIGCEPADLGNELEGKMGLSVPVLAAIDDAIRQIESLVEDLLENDGVQLSTPVSDCRKPVSAADAKVLCE